VKELGPGYSTSFRRFTHSTGEEEVTTSVKVHWREDALYLTNGETSVCIMEVLPATGSIRMYGELEHLPVRFELGDGREIIWGEGYFTVDGERYETPLERGYTYMVDGLLISP
jgi:hypothetical protein